jgi:hypothetical protein
VNFNGTITSVTDTVGPLGDVGGINVGDSFTGSFTYESTASGGDIDADPNRGLYFFTPAGFNTVSVTIDGLTFDTNPTQTSGADIRNNTMSTLSANTDLLNVFKGGPNLPAGWSVALPASSLLQVAYLDAAGTALPNDSLPSSFSLADWDVGAIFLSFAGNVTFPGGNDNAVSIEGTINFTPVPEPSGLLLMSTAAFALSLVRRRLSFAGIKLPATA